LIGGSKPVQVNNAISSIARKGFLHDTIKSSNSILRRSALER
jgi:hypothetical protein